MFQGSLKKISIVSSPVSFDLTFPNNEIEQRLTINNRGQVWLTRQQFDKEKGTIKLPCQRLIIEKSLADRIMTELSLYFKENHEDEFFMGTGGWMSELVNTDSESYSFYEPLVKSFSEQLTALSKVIRKALNQDDLYVFDGDYRLDVIEKITIDYWQEKLIIDRISETLCYVKERENEYLVTREFTMKNEVSELLDQFKAEELFLELPKNRQEVKDYTITLDYKKKPRKIITGRFDKKGLPVDFKEFAKKVDNFIKKYDLGDILNPGLYEKAKRKKAEIIFCSVIFDGESKSYYYLTNDESIRVGDMVVVPVGRSNQEAVVKVVKVEYFAREEVPRPIEATKYILSKKRIEEEK